MNHSIVNQPSVPLWITHEACLRHDMGPGHPECPARLSAIEDRLRASGLMDLFQRQCAPQASREQLLRVHGAGHVEATYGGPHIIDGDTEQTEHTLEAALHAAGAVVAGVERVLAGEARFAFCAVRPPGHHAEADRAMGFCFFNNAAVGAAHALSRGLERIALIDFDVHYGNGSADIFRHDPRVWLYSTYQQRLYPHWRGAPECAHLVDAPLPAGAGSEAFRHAVTTHWLPALETQRPELILVSAGFDAHADDPLADLHLGHDDYHWVGTLLRDVAAACGHQRVVATLEGGYDLRALARSVEAFVQPFAGL